MSYAGTGVCGRGRAVTAGIAAAADGLPFRVPIAFAGDIPMKTSFVPRQAGPGAWLQALAAGVLACSAALQPAQAAEPAATGAATSQAQQAQQAERERAACLNGTSQQDKATCLREVGAAQEERRRGTLADGQAGRYQDNAAERCKSLPAADQADCVRRARGEGERSGSVKAGGVLTSTTTITVGQPVPAASAASSPASDPAPVR
jgi:hypothetical protein